MIMFSGLGGMAAAVVIGSMIFGVSIWTYMPEEKSSFADGFWRGVQRCTVFSVVYWVLLFALIDFLGWFGLALWFVLFFIGMKKIFFQWIF